MPEVPLLEWAASDSDQTVRTDCREGQVRAERWSEYCVGSAGMEARGSPKVSEPGWRIRWTAGARFIFLLEKELSALDAKANILSTSVNGNDIRPDDRLMVPTNLPRIPSLKSGLQAARCGGRNSRGTFVGCTCAWIGILARHLSAPGVKMLRRVGPQRSPINRVLSRRRCRDLPTEVQRNPG